MKERLFRRITPERLEELLEIVGRKSIAVIGDFCLDVYWTLNMSASEISLETGKRTQPVKNQRYSPGGAGNVVANLFDLGAGNVSSFGATGSDPFGEKMRTLLGHLSDCSSLMTCETEEYQTLTYIKPYDGREELGRLDVGNFNSLPDCLALELISSLESRLAGFDIVIVNQQVATGIHTKKLQEKMSALISANPEKAFIFDSRHIIERYPDAWLKINASEALRLSGNTGTEEADIISGDVLKAVEKLVGKLPHPLVVTRGSHGCIIGSREEIVRVPGIRIEGETDPVGAGDSFLSGYAASLAAGASLEEAAQTGNLAAAVTVRKIGQTGTANPEEIIALAREAVFEEE